ncbi:MAG: ATP-binding cassette domain-containing protein [Coriobacteriaceae bacterium]|nr:ATP-binding cassette domain-containing protein [Coriobacteriaceae bacterium]
MRASNLSKHYGTTPVVGSVDIELPRGRVISLIGPNGAGKSTVMGMLSRLIWPDGGEVTLEGRPLRSWNSTELSKRIAILTQQNNLDMKLTVRELVSFGRFPYSRTRLTREDHAIVERAIDYMELGPLAERFIDELSGGERQRAHIAMAIAQDTDYILLDEPTNNLDIYHATALMRTVRRLADELGRTVVVVLHEINYAAFYSDYVYALKDGAVAAKGTVEEVMRRDVLSKIYGVDFEIIRVKDRPLSLYY